jgi:hypothetical protein
MPMTTATNSYTELRDELLAARESLTVREHAVSETAVPVSERLAQCIWYDQRLQCENLRTADGRPVKIISAGAWNTERGPDFQRASIQIAGAEPQSGDIEVHLLANEWYHHGHERDHAYDNVMLHVVMWKTPNDRPTMTRGGKLVPQLELAAQLDAPIEVLYDEMDTDAYPYANHLHVGRCEKFLNAMGWDGALALLESAGDEWFTQKKRKFLRAIGRVGPAQAFYEGWMEALGYKANKKPFKLLAQRLPLSAVENFRPKLPAIMFGLAGFLPAENASGYDMHAKRLIKRWWDDWWRVRDHFKERMVSADDWQFHGVRPANHPHRRLAAAVRLLLREKNFDEHVMKVVAASKNATPLENLFINVHDEYWDFHYTLGGKRQIKRVELIGPPRARDIVANVVLPFVAARAEWSGDPDARVGVKAADLFAKLPKLSGNTAVQEASHRLFGTLGGLPRGIQSARQQQGLLQIFKDFCLNDKSNCRDCAFPELAQRWAGATDPATR